MYLQHSALLGRIRWPHIAVLAGVALAGGLMATPASATASGTWTHRPGERGAVHPLTSQVLEVRVLRIPRRRSS